MATYAKVEDARRPSAEYSASPPGSDEDGLVYVRRRRSRWSLFRSWFGSYALGVLSTCLVIAAWSKVGNVVTKPTYKYADTDALPTVPYETVTFDTDPLYAMRPSDDTDAAWNQLLPPGRGFVYVPDSAARGLPRGEKVAHGEIYSVSMYHQLHCLARMRKMHWIYLDAVVTGDMGMAKSVSGRTQADHVQHCIDYLRQAILCNGDMTLEWPKIDGVSSGVKVDGWKIPHTCKSPTAINEFMDKYHYNESMSIDAAG